jgi:hypothetical protein
MAKVMGGYEIQNLSYKLLRRGGRRHKSKFRRRNYC